MRKLTKNLKIFTESAIEQDNGILEGAGLLDKKEAALARTKKVDLMRKEGSLTKEKILDLTLKHQARRLEIPVGHPFVLE